VGLRAVMLHYPLKTSHEKGQLFGGIPCTDRAGFHVAFTRLRWCVSRLILVAMIWSSVGIWWQGFLLLADKRHEASEWGMQGGEE